MGRAQPQDQHASMQTQARRRLQQLVKTVQADPGSVSPSLELASCAGPGPSVRELEGEAIGRFVSTKVVLLKIGGRGVPLASQREVDRLFRQRSLQPIWVEEVEQIPSDTFILVTTGMRIDVSILDRTPKLGLIAIAFTGVDHVDTAACKARGVRVVNVPDYSTDATAELALGMVLSHLRRLATCQQNIKDGVWSCPKQEELQEKVVGLVGVGKIGLRLAELMKAFKVKSLLGYSQHHDSAFVLNGGMYVESLAGLFLDADIVIVCLPLTPRTRGMVSEKILELLRPQCILVNVSRGEVVDEEALARLVTEGRFRAALDVFGTEPLPPENPLRKASPDDLIMTPHIGYQSASSLGKRLEMTVKNILAFLAGQAVNVVI